MLVVLINESEGKAWKRTRRVLAKYLPQIGSRVWAGHISEEGLKDLHQEIKKTVSKAGSVSCHRVMSRNRLELQWIAGQKDFYDSQGRYAFRTTHIRKEYSTEPLGPYAELVYLCRRMAALLHDIGKATLAFQGKLRGAYHHEEYRHDLVGFLMLQQRFAASQPPDDQVFLTELAKAEPLWPEGELLFETKNQPTHFPNLSPKQLKTWLATAPIFSLVSWLVLSHHRLPAGNDQIEVCAKDPTKKSTHVNQTTSQDGKVATRILSQQAANSQLPWQEPKWQTQVTAIAEKISALLNRYPDLRADLTTNTGDWILANVHYNRPLLIAADHLASIQCNTSKLAVDKASPSQPAYANTYQEQQKPYWGDTLPQHLLRVEKLTRKLKTLLANAGHFRSAGLPITSQARIPITAPNFYWQQKLAEAAQHTLENRSVFAAILAETGSGKTLAGVRLLAAISPKDEQGEPRLRYTLALGLRSLTLQSATALREQALISQEDFVTLVGGLVLDDTQNSSESSEASKNGKENTTADDENGYSVGGKDINTLNPDNMPWLDCLDAHLDGDCQGKRDRPALFKIVHEWLGQRGLQLLETPIVACTVDHLVPATHATSGGDARMALRIFTSDLILDEIDNYSAQDLITLGKLCFMVGLAGRHVILMSATMGPYVVQGLFDAWWRGLCIKAKLDAPSFNSHIAHPLPARLIFAGNQPGLEVECHDLHTHVPAKLMLHYNDYVKRTCIKIQATAQRRHLDILRLTPLAQATDKTRHLRSQIYAEILQGCYQLHQINAQKIDNINVSIGFIRFNTAKQAWRYSRWLLERQNHQDAYNYQVVCYHAKHPRLVLGLMDAKLNQLNNRKHDSNWQDLPELQAALAQTKTKTKQDLMIIVVTTTLQETGRDHDYDWAILEPRSVRGEVQAAGRVRRHRPQPWDKLNILILSQPLRAFSAQYDADKYKTTSLGNLLLWGMPGIETNDIPICLPVFEDLQDQLSEMEIIFKKGTAQRIDQAEQALPIQLWQQQGLNSNLCLLTPGKTTYSYDENPIGTLEHLYSYARLGKDYDPDTEKQSLKAYLTATTSASNPALALTKAQYGFNRFRESLTKTITIYCCYTDLDNLFKKFYVQDCDGKPNLDNNTVELVSSEQTKLLEERIFFNALANDVRAHFAVTPQPAYEAYQALFCDLDYYQNPAYYFHWALGYCPRSPTN